jgi:hypothetical protein
MNVKKQDSIHLSHRAAPIATAVAFLIAAVLSLFSPQMGGFLFRENYSRFSAGQIADRDLVAPKAVEYVRSTETTRKIEEARAQVLPVYAAQEKAILESLHSLEQFFDYLNEKRALGNSPSLLAEIESRFSVRLDQRELELLLQGNTKSSSLFPLIEELVTDFMEHGVFESLPQVSGDSIMLQRWEHGEKGKSVLSIGDLIIPSRIPDAVRSSLAGTGIDEKTLDLIERLTLHFITPNVRFDSVLTEEAKAKAAAGVAPVTGEIEEGERVIRKGFIVTENDMEKIQAISQAQTGIQYGMIIATFLYLALMFFLGFILLSPYLQPRWRTFQFLMLMLITWLFFFASAALSFFLTGEDWTMLRAFFLPSALVSMLITSMIGEKAAFLLIFLSAFSIVPFVPIGKMDLIFIIVSGLTGIHVIRKSERRIDLVRGGALISCIHLLMVLVIGLLSKKPVSWFASAAGLAIINALACTVLNLTILPVIEHFLNAPTVFRLIELSDMNTPLFKRMIMAAPGTYSHSVSVANMAESACRAIGANHLLARVGAYYHDIGKIEQPEYFIENQTGNNKHDELKPSLSVAVIKSHVKIGIEKAKELKLPPEVVDIVGQHHGNGLIEYFYTEALKNEEENQKISPEEYSYNGSPPVSREAAVVMLADTIEAATRTLKKPTVAKLEKFIWSKIMDKVINRQMINCDLTFRDMEKIKQSFVQILAGHFHSRIEYPKAEEGKRKTHEQS